MTDKKKSAPKKREKQAKKQSPMRWCLDLQKHTTGRPPMGNIIPVWQHNAAAALHGWGKHEHAANEPIQITEQAYLDALAAVEVSPLKPCAEALSEYMDR